MGVRPDDIHKVEDLLRVLRKYGPLPIPSIYAKMDKTLRGEKTGIRGLCERLCKSGVLIRRGGQRASFVFYGLEGQEHMFPKMPISRVCSTFGRWC